MDMIQHCLSLAPVPYLSPVFSIFKILWKSIQQKGIEFRFLFLLDGFLKVAYRFSWCNLDLEELVELGIIDKIKQKSRRV